MQIVNGLEMSLAKQYFDNLTCLYDLFLSNNGIALFLEQKKNSKHGKRTRGFLITRDSRIFSIRSDTFWLKDFVNNYLKINLEGYF